MTNGSRGPCRQLAGVFFWLVLTLAVLAPRAEAAKFCHTELGSLDVYSSDTPDNTRRLIYELLEVRRQMQALVAPVPLPDPRMQILVFNRQKDYEEFLPPPPKWDKKETTVSGFTAYECAIVAAVVKEGPGYEFGRKSLRLFYASLLLRAAVPDAPLWIQAGLPEFLASTESRGKSLYVGADFMDHLGNLRASKFLPLAQLMDDDSVRQYYGAARHDNPLYHESWALWHRWLTDPDPRRRAQVNRLLGAIRDGSKGDLATVVECFGETAEAIDQARRSPERGRGYPVVESNPDASSLAPGLGFKPATELDGSFARALLAGSRGEGPGKLAYELSRYAEAEPLSPRPPEGLAILAMGEGDSNGADVRWEKARELGTTNPFAFLVSARAALANRAFTLAPRAQLPGPLCATWRKDLARCVALDPGSIDAQYYRILVEAFAPDPDAVAIDAVARSQVLLLRPQGYIYLAIARWRLGQVQEAQQILTSLGTSRRLNASNLRHVTLLLEAIKKEAAKNPAPKSVSTPEA